MKNPKDRKSEITPVRLTPAERAALEAIVRRDGHKSFSAAIRELIRRAAINAA